MRKTQFLTAMLTMTACLLLGGVSILGETGDETKAVPVAEDFDIGKMINQFRIRNIGPASMGGRTVDFAVPESNTSVIYAAVGPSGVWKSEDAGMTWEPCFTEEATVAVGAVAVSQSHPDIVWVGTGEATARNSVAPGDGVYKSEDAGRTWKNMGLVETRFISRIVIDPQNPDIVYVAAQGHLWGPNEERGVYRTSDGGKSWEKVLYVNPETGACDPHVTYGYGTQIVEIEVNTETGEVRLKNVWAAHDVGQALNPLHVEGQIQGAIAQAQGWTLLEDFIMQEGQLRTKSYADYLIPTVYDVPEIHPLVLEIGDPQGPYGARGLGEMPMLVLAPAILDAIHDATGIWFDKLPVKAEDVLLALKAKHEEAA